MSALLKLCEIIKEELQIGTLLREDCCIMATATLIDVMDYFKLRVRPLSVKAQIFNPEMSRRIEESGLPTLEEAEKDWFPRSCWSVGLGHGEEQPWKWPGHLVGILKEEILIDLTMDQCRRPEKNIELPGVVLIPLDGDFLKAEGAMIGFLNGCRVHYVAFPEDQSYKKARDWSEKKRRSRFVGAAIRRFKKEMKDG